MSQQQYNSFEEIQADLLRLNLERKIYLEELKLTKHQLKEDLKPINWVTSILSSVKKFGVLYALKKIIK